ncbi:hypothetical protein AYO40_04685 [Planctomycetaceae bacterium SCGC AG-212-D15]|nr:hypothetical protein AYO40_04685 [Planctomycetaceae bacterium SCGC AG-212-D15]
MRVVFDAPDDGPDHDDGWQPSLFGGPGAESVLRQRPLFEGGMERSKAPAVEAREDQPEMFAERRLTFTYSIVPDVRIRFSDKPDERIRAMLKANGFRWSPAVGQWWRTRVGGAADFLAALDKVLNPGRPDGACWRCNSPNGFFRRQGAATPVYCDSCHKALSEKKD